MRASSTGNEENKWRKLRESVNMTQKEFSEFTTIPKRSLENWENNTRSSPDYVYNLTKEKVENYLEKNKK